ncbi:hypothetical protein DH2020_043352 [Rehmannia glutinosa]|uniref:Pentatricopeptide repeat-containing protein n=1 Tax=Rehmannia glutinosa TaxID=99300 RepID=A0ABR0UKB4_REHGL
MSKRVLKSAVFSPAPLLNSFKSFNRFFSTDNGLEGLIAHHEISDSIDTPHNSSAQHFSAQDLAFFRESFSDTKVADIEAGKCLTDAFSIIDAIKNYNDGLGEKSQKFLRQFREKLDEGLVVDVLRNVQNAELGVRFFLWAGRQIGYSHSITVYNALLELLARDKNDRVADHFLLEIKNDDSEVLGRLLNVLIRKCCNNGMCNLALEELGRLKNFGYKPSRVTYNALIRVFLEAGKLDSAFLLHKEMLQLGFKMDMHILGFFVQFLCKVGKWRDALNMIEKEDVRADTLIYTKMITGLCEASLFEEAMEFLNRMRANSCFPNVVTRLLSKSQNILFSCPCVLQNGDHSYAYKLLKKMADCGCKPGYVVYNILIGSICGNEDFPSSDVLELAKKAYGEMLDAGIALNRVNVSNFARCLCGAGSTYNKVIGFLCDASKLDKALKLFREMKKNGVVPNVYTYSIMIDRFCKAGLIQQARCWFDEMMRDGCSPTVVTYTALIHAYLKARKITDANEVGKLDEAQEIFAKMSECGYIPNVYTYSSLIDRLFKDKRLDLALKVLAKMLEYSCPPNVVIYTEMVDGLCKVGKTSEAYKLMLMMEEKGCNPNVVTYTAMIDGFGKAGKVDKSLETFQEMINKGCAPNYITYRVLINHCCGAGRLDEAYQLLEEMKQTYWPSHLANYQKVVEGFSKEFLLSLQLVDEMGKNDSVPLIPIYKVLIDSFQRAGRLEMALQLHKEFSSLSISSSTDMKVYTSLIGSLSASHRVDEAFELYADIVGKGEIPEFGVFIELIKGLLKVNRWEDALILSESLCYMVKSDNSRCEAQLVFIGLYKSLYCFNQRDRKQVTVEEKKTTFVLSILIGIVLRELNASFFEHKYSLEMSPIQSMDLMLDPPEAIAASKS